MDAIVATINSMPPAEKAIIFVQFDEMKLHLFEALREAGIALVDATKRAASKVRAFEDSEDDRVLVLQIDTPDAAGWNLQCVNHVLFVSPFLAGSQHIYDSIMKQAVGRALRPGQPRKVAYVYFFAMAHTCEVNMLEDREGGVLVRRGGEVVRVEKVLARDERLRGESVVEGEDEEGEEAEGGDE